jgi:hypothetical protein
MSELALALLFAVFIWWFSTGIVLMLNRMSRGAVTLSLLLSSLLGPAGAGRAGPHGPSDHGAGAYCAFTWRCWPGAGTS